MSLTIKSDHLEKERMERFLNRCIHILPEEHVFLDTSKLTILYFALSSFDLLDSLDKVKATRDEILNWIYSLQIEADGKTPGSWGFRGSPNNGKGHAQDKGHLTMIYCALNCLLILGDDLSCVNKKAIINGLSEYQMQDGSFCPSIGEESDMRFVFCAAAICYMLDDWSGINVDQMVQYIMACRTYEGAFGQCPGNEAHGGSTYCAIASLVLVDRLDQQMNEEKKQELIRWCLMKQSSGFEGRPNKKADTCYTFWIGATLHMLNAHTLVNANELISFVIRTQNLITGGFAKHPDNCPDVLHTYLGLSGLSLFSETVNLGLRPVCAMLNLSERAMRWLHKLQNHC